METDPAARREYACAIGLVMLAFGDLEAEMLSLMERLGSKLSQPSLEEMSFGNRIKETECLAIAHLGEPLGTGSSLSVRQLENWQISATASPMGSFGRISMGPTACARF